MLDLSSVLTLQGAQSTTWCRLPLGNDSLTIPEIYAFHANNSPEHPLFVYPDEDGEVQTIYYPEVYRAIRRASKFVTGHYKHMEARDVPQMKQRGSRSSIIGILATADTITTFTLIVGILHAGHSAFPISTRNSAAAVAHLVQKTGISQLFVSSDAAMQSLSHSASKLLADNGISIEILPMPHYADFYDDRDDYDDAIMPKRSIDDVALIMHSSGSTAFPKPIEFTHRAASVW